MLSLPEVYWRRVLAIQTDQMSSSSPSTMTYSQDGGHGGFTVFFLLVNSTGPLTGLAGLSLFSHVKGFSFLMCFYVSRSVV